MHYILFFQVTILIVKHKLKRFGLGYSEIQDFEQKKYQYLEQEKSLSIFVKF